MNEAEAYANYMGEGPYDDPPDPDDVDEAEDVETDDDDEDVLGDDADEHYDLARDERLFGE